MPAPVSARPPEGSKMQPTYVHEDGETVVTAAEAGVTATVVVAIAVVDRLVATAVVVVVVVVGAFQSTKLNKDDRHTPPQNDHRSPGHR